MKVLWIGLPLALASVGCASHSAVREEPGRDPGDYFPLAVGDRWTYQVKFLGEQREQTVQVVKREDGFFRQEITTPGPSGKPSVETAQVTVDAYGVRDDRRYLLEHPVKAGNSWKNRVSVSEVEYYQIEEAGVPCEVPAGKFADCATVSSRVKLDDKSTLVNRMTFARGVGIVRGSVVLERGNQRVPQHERVLTSYQVAPPGAR